jgi:hypothetical protein
MGADTTTGEATVDGNAHGDTIIEDFAFVFTEEDAPDLYRHTLFFPGTKSFGGQILQFIGLRGIFL